MLLAESLRAVGLPWVPSALWRRPRETWMSLDARFQAIRVVGRVIAEARDLLPAGVMVDRRLRDAAWRCTVAGLALLDTDARRRLADEHAQCRGAQ
jgi:hypothetical protein